MQNSGSAGEWDRGERPVWEGDQSALGGVEGLFLQWWYHILHSSTTCVRVVAIQKA